jgi:hypothetical protein
VSSELYGCTTTSLLSLWLGKTLRGGGVRRGEERPMGRGSAQRDPKIATASVPGPLL